MLDEYPDTLQVANDIYLIRANILESLSYNLMYFQESLTTLHSIYIRDSRIGVDCIDSGRLGRLGSLHAAADVLRTKDLPDVMTFLISQALVSVLSLYIAYLGFYV